MLKTLEYTNKGQPEIVGADAFVMRRADVTPLPTRKMQAYLNEQGMRIVRKSDGFHIGVVPVFDGPEAA